ncbi:MAG: alkaline phosphatase, partial [Bacteroidota bacterium]
MKNIKLYFLAALLIVGFTYGCNQAEKEKSTSSDKVENIILFIGDGMGVSQIYAGMTVSEEPLVFEEFRHIGFQKTFSADDYVTGSAASGTAMATGKKTKNG